MIIFFVCFLATVSALSAERAALCQFAEAIPYLRNIGWKNCTEMTDSTNLESSRGLVLMPMGKYTISIYDQAVVGTLPDVFDKLPNLEHFNLMLSSTSGTLPASISRSNLIRIVFNNNPNLSGTLPEFPRTIQDINIQSTPFSGSMPGLLNNANLTSLQIRNTKLSGDLPDLRNNANLVSLMITSTNLTGSVENLYYNTKLSILEVSRTSMAGALPDFGKLINLSTATITNNLISGVLPSSLAEVRYLDLSSNRLSGTIPVIYFNSPRLVHLYLASNDFSGTVPWKDSSLTALNLGNNRLSGPLPNTPFKGNMVLFYLENNQFSGTIPATFFQSASKSINTINLSNNRLEGTIPDDFSALQNAVDINLADNNLSGPIPIKLFSSLSGLQYIRLQNNKLSGVLQGAFQNRAYGIVNLANNSLTGKVPANFFSGANFVSLDISGNDFTGCGPFEPNVNLDCNFGGAYYSGCTPSYNKCKNTVLNNCPKGSDYFGSTCRPCNCSSGLICNDGVIGNGTCEGFNPCRGNNCEGICHINGIGFVCSCPFPGIIDSNDQRSCNCPFGFTKGSQGACIACPSIDNCLQIESCGVCSICRSGYKLTPFGCELDKHCLFSDWTSWSKCENCMGGITIRYRNLSEKNTALPFYCQEFLYNATACGFPCVETSIISKDAILDYLYRSYTQWNWLVRENNLTGVNITKTADLLIISPFSNLAWLEESVHNILPSVNESRYHFSIDDDSVTIEVLEEEKPGIAGIAVGVSVAIVLALSGVLFFLFRQRKKRWIFDLPKELQFYFHPKGSGWITEGNCKMREIPIQDEAFQAIWSVLSTREIAIDSVYVVSNSILGASFSNYRSILRQRMVENPTLFCKKDWLLRSEQSDLRSYVHERYIQLAEYFSWNDPEETVPILACLHATDFDTAKSISSKGFCALATLDEGFYGKGIYFSTYGSYVAPYFLGKQKPAILVNLAICGNAFPIVEAATDKNGFLGKPTASGYQSHFVLTKSDGTPIKTMHSDDESNEIVVSQEAQVVPIYIVRVASGQKLEQFTRNDSSLTVPLLGEKREAV